MTRTVRHLMPLGQRGAAGASLEDVVGSGAKLLAPTLQLCAKSDDSEWAAPFGRGRGIARSWDAVESRAGPPLLPQPSGGRCTATESSPRCRSALWGPPWTARAAALRALRWRARLGGATSGFSWSAVL
eukprot:CAMPEP_0118809820 /NCGR_PEP_ID=MMETSP1162-20130426/577_1 /TAXON_ID=33656 /ORGANISM="Phaeocystis Sp, Strain CCMP2710" /LENGTH=128 /DNA_ID=CAMNT_0006739289 /DNA_START=227 /DNA_END=614 /DNA_ORIENTATION=+